MNETESQSPKTPRSSRSKERLRLWLRLLSSTRTIEKVVRSRFEEKFSATLPRFDVMAALYREPAGLSMGQLSRWLRVSNGNVTGVIARLEAEGCVERKPQPEDRRWITVKLTLQGRLVFERLASAHESWIDEMLAALEPAEEQQLMTLLAKLRDGVDRRPPDRNA